MDHGGRSESKLQEASKNDKGLNEDSMDWMNQDAGVRGCLKAMVDNTQVPDLNESRQW